MVTIYDDCSKASELYELRGWQHNCSNSCKTKSFLATSRFEKHFVATILEKKLQRMFLYILKYIQQKPWVKFDENMVCLLRRISKEAPNFQPATVVLPLKLSKLDKTARLPELLKFG